MRIRKHAQKSQTCCLPSQLPSPNPCPSKTSPTRVCELNRSPWDVISFTPEAMIEDSVSSDENGGETSADGVESIPSSTRTWEEDDNKLKLDEREISWSSSSPTVVVSVSGKERRNKEMKSKSRKEGSFICCNKTDGKGWKCKKEAKRGHSLCEHHLAQLKSYYTNNKSGNRSSFLYGRGGKSGGARGKRSSSKKSSSNYYYYTGFGPLWGKGRGEHNRRDMEVDSEPSSSTPSLSSVGDAVDDDDDVEDEDDDDDFGRKRARKPVKTRSLKSLL
ncbi:hypothetical protein NE237_028476 [Protea cynaroides]|uniref:WRC domain-containing protein n=1 Tax=Protea cynaroides TaxID=273540 RepID=A0A9Q0GQD4_9MAGN|nr:hypothetical protein NE237_028476 [Protea cynaroides]